MDIQERRLLQYTDGYCMKEKNRRIKIYASGGLLILETIRTFKEGEYTNDFKDTPQQWMFTKMGKMFLISRVSFSKDGLYSLFQILLNVFKGVNVWNGDKLNIEQEAQASVATDDDSSKKVD